jgi:hypothetical protein
MHSVHRPDTATPNYLKSSQEKIRKAIRHDLCKATPQVAKTNVTTLGIAKRITEHTLPFLI